MLPTLRIVYSELGMRILNQATFLMRLLLKNIFKYSGKTNATRASETGLSGKANQL